LLWCLSIAEASRSRVSQQVFCYKIPCRAGDGVQLVWNLSRTHNFLSLAKHPLILSFPLLLWPAVLNGYPIVFADTGTYLAQAIHRFAGWDRPVFYSVFMLPLHATVTLWPVVVVQAVLAAWILGWSAGRCFPKFHERLSLEELRCWRWRHGSRGW
jgi:hypothetical protein